MEKTTRKENRKRMQKTACLLMLLLLCVFVVPVNAASDKTVKKAYASFLTKSGKKYKYFKVLNIGTNKEPILLAQKKVGEGNTASEADLFYYKNGKVKAINTKSIETRGTSYLLSYKKGYLIIPDRWGGITRIQVKKGKTVGDALYYNLVDDNHIYYTYLNGEYTYKKNISKERFDKYVTRWEGKAIKFVKNTKANRKKYLGK